MSFYVKHKCLLKLFKIFPQNSILLGQENLHDGCDAALDLLVNGEITSSGGSRQ